MIIKSRRQWKEYTCQCCKRQFAYEYIGGPIRKECKRSDCIPSADPIGRKQWLEDTRDSRTSS